MAECHLARLELERNGIGSDCVVRERERVGDDGVGVHACSGSGGRVEACVELMLLWS